MPFFTDDFAGANGASIIDDVAWSANTTTAANTAVVTTGNGTCRNNAGGDTLSITYVVPQSGSADQRITATIDFVTAAAFCSLMQRALTNARTAYECYWFNGIWTLQRTEGGAAAEVFDTFSDAISDGQSRDVVFDCVTNGSQVDLSVTINGVEQLTGSDSDAARITAINHAGVLWFTTYNNSSGPHLDSFVVSDLQADALEISPDTVSTVHRNQALTVTCAAATWTSAAPDFEVTDGTIDSVTVTSDTTAIVRFTAQVTERTATLTDNTTGSSGTISIVAVTVILEGDSQVEGSLNDFPTYLEDALGPLYSVHNVATGGETLLDMNGQVASQIAPLWDADNPFVIVLCEGGTNDGYLDDATGAEIAGYAEDEADACHLLGDNVSFITYTIAPRNYAGGGGFDPDDPDLNTRLAAASALIRADANDKFDRCVDVENLFTNYATDLQVDVLHWNEAFAEIVANESARQIQLITEGSSSPWSAYINDVYAPGVWADGVWSDAV